MYYFNIYILCYILKNLKLFIYTYDIVSFAFAPIKVEDKIEYLFMSQQESEKPIKTRGVKGHIILSSFSLQNYDIIC